MSAVRVIQNFLADTNVYGGPPMMKLFARGEIIRNERLIERLKATNCPVAELTDNTLAYCPVCNEVCSRETHATTVQYVTLACVIPYNGSYFTFKAGDVIQHPWFADALKAADMPLEETLGVRCPKCKSLFY